MAVYDFSDTTAVNIDSIMDAVVKSRRESGVGGVPEEAIVDDQTGRRYRRFQKRSKREEEIYQTLKNEQKVSSSRGGKESTVFNMRSVQGLHAFDNFLNGSDDEYDSAPTFICTFCSKLSRGKKYNPVVCDSCTECLSCNQFAKKECSGCEYSRWREGIPYGQLTQSCAMDNEDMVLLNEALSVGGDNHSKFDDIRITDWSVTDV